MSDHELTLTPWDALQEMVHQGVLTEPQAEALRGAARAGEPITVNVGEKAFRMRVHLTDEGVSLSSADPQ